MQKTWPKAHILRLQAMEEADKVVQAPSPAPEPIPVPVQQEPVAMVQPVLSAAPMPPVVGAAPNPNA